MTKIKKFLNWCPQPKMTIPKSHLRISKYVLASALAAEIILLLVIPVTYFILLAPKPPIIINQEFPLSNEEIKTAWPNLPTAQQIVNTGVYGFTDTRDYIVSPNSDASHIYLTTKPRYWDNTSLSFAIQNTTVTNSINTLMGGLTPRFYHIFIQLNDTVWIEVPQTFLTSTSHPPTLPSDQPKRFLGTALPTDYAIFAIVVVAATAIVSLSYFISTNGKKRPKTVSNQI